MNRRDFLKATGGAAAFMALSGNRAYAFSNSMPLTKFATTLRGISGYPYSTAGIPVFTKDGNSVAGVDHYTIEVAQYTDQLHPSLPHVNLFGYRDPTSGVQRHLGGIIVANRGTACQLSFLNKLPNTHILPVDTGGFFPDAASHPTAIATHLHGGFVPWISDGGPFDWVAPYGTAHGPSFQNNQAPGFYPCTPTGDAEYYYPNNQGARLMWYHDHAHDVTRLNAYAGIATAYIIRDAAVEGTGSGGLDLPLIENSGPEIPLIFQDKIFKNGNPQAVKAFPQYELPVGDLWYPYVYDRARWTLSGRRIPNTPSCIPEMFGDTMLVNGTVCPTVSLSATIYRFRILNACNARFVNLQLIQKDNSASGITLDGLKNPTNLSGPPMVQIGTEAGFLPKEVTFPGYVNATNGTGTPFIVTLDLLNGNPTFMQHNLLLGPAERADVIIDFTNYAGKTLILYTDCQAPFPGGDPRNDYLPLTGSTPDTRTLMQIVVGSAVTNAFTPVYANLPGAAADPAFLVTQSTTIITPGPTSQSNWATAPVAIPNPIPNGGTLRDLTLNEGFDQYGRLVQEVGTCAATATGFFGRMFDTTATEYLDAGATEVWRFANTTADTHPMHFHLINAQILSRQKFDVAAFQNSGNSATYGLIDACLVAGTAYGPDANELGWKETIRMNPGEVVTFIAKYDLPAVPFTIPSTTRANALVPLGTKTTLHEYVYHCHILEHEEHDMMRPLIVRS